MQQEEWKRLARIVAPHLKRYTDDAEAYAVSLIPVIMLKRRPATWRGTDDGWCIQQCRREAFRYEWIDARRGLTMRNGSKGWSHDDIDREVGAEGGSPISLGDTLEGDQSPEDWIEASEEVSNLLASRRALASGPGMWIYKLLNRFSQQEATR